MWNSSWYDYFPQWDGPKHLNVFNSKVDSHVGLLEHYYNTVFLPLLPRVFNLALHSSVTYLAAKEALLPNVWPGDQQHQHLLGECSTW